MKKRYMLLLAFCCLSTSIFASHLMGGQITVSQIGTNSYVATLTLYRDSTGISAPTMGAIVIKNLTTGVNTTRNLPNISGIPFSTGVEEYVYQDTLSFSAFGAYNISYSLCCRNDAILNIVNSASQSFYINTILEIDSIVVNSTPVFLNPPVTVAQKNMLYQYNPLPFDSDGDSLAWSMVTPLGSAGVTLGYSAPYANPGDDMVINQNTGEITWTPNTLGNFVASFLIEEFRAGVKIGEIRRDMQIIVLGQSANPNQSSVNKSVFTYSTAGQYFINAPIGQQTVVTVSVTDQDNDLLKLSMNGEPFILTNNPSTYTAINGNGSANISFIWTPNQSHLRIAPYVVALRTKEFHGPYMFVSDFTFQVNAGGVLSTTTNSTANSLGQVYPNPVQGSVNIPFNLVNSSQVVIELIDMKGQVVAKLLDQNMPAGNNHFITKLPTVAKGVYMLSYLAGNNAPQMQRIVISE